MSSISNVPLLMLQWDNPNNRKAFLEWKDFLSSFIINNVQKEQIYNYMLLSSRSKGRDLFKAKQVSTEDKANSDKLWNMFEDYMVEKPNKWVQRIELQCMTQSTDETRRIYSLS
ncbi:hypothetical protein PoB_005257300 [Plakobranchus ocellatus]|uniref:Uncharacterized protein n=1 Tax=Plakobranchus ocellatus TaxID=259542 RepID=A0AAV4C506_9GAST|nr:hypothetical protein PoB_005257300 [Plakobranchus ocellatus]